MEEMLKQVLQELKEIKSDMATKRDVQDIKELLHAYHAENIATDDKLLEAVRTTNDRLDFQLGRLAKTEEAVYLIQQKQ